MTLGLFSRLPPSGHPAPVVKIKVALRERVLTFEGREADTLNRLVVRADAGLTSIENHGPRISTSARRFASLSAPAPRCVMRHDLRVIDGGLSFQPGTKLPHAPAARIAGGMTMRGEYIRFSPALRQKLATIAADLRVARRRGGAANASPATGALPAATNKGART